MTFLQRAAEHGCWSLQPGTAWVSAVSSHSTLSYVGSVVATVSSSHLKFDVGRWAECFCPDRNIFQHHQPNSLVPRESACASGTSPVFPPRQQLSREMRGFREKALCVLTIDMQQGAWCDLMLGQEPAGAFQILVLMHQGDDTLFSSLALHSETL